MKFSKNNFFFIKKFQINSRQNLKGKFNSSSSDTTNKDLKRAENID